MNVLVGQWCVKHPSDIVDKLLSISQQWVVEDCVSKQSLADSRSHCLVARPIVMRHGLALVHDQHARGTPNGRGTGVGRWRVLEGLAALVVVDAGAVLRHDDRLRRRRIAICSNLQRCSYNS